MKKQKKQKHSTSTLTCCKSSRPCPAVSQYQLDALVTQDTQLLPHPTNPSHLWYMSYVSLQGETLREKAQQGLLSQLVHNRLFFPCWCLTGSSFLACALQITYFKILPWQANKMATGHKTHKLQQFNAT